MDEDIRVTESAWGTDSIVVSGQRMPGMCDRAAGDLPSDENVNLVERVAAPAKAAIQEWKTRFRSRSVTLEGLV